MIARELYMRRIRPFIDSELVKVMTGMRRSGKSVMMELIRQELTSRGVAPEHIFSFNFEDMRLAHLLTAESLHNEILRRVCELRGKFYFFFDEIQEVAHWEKCINSLRVEMDCDIYVTGSNAKLLSGELATYLGGRYVEFVIYPFSFSEFLAAYRQVFPDTSEAGCFREYIRLGGMPYLSHLRYEEEPCRQYLTDVFRSVQLKDVIQRNAIRDTDLLERIILYVMANLGSPLSAASLSRYLKNEHRSAAGETIQNYLRYCTDAYLFYPARRQDLRGKQVLSVNEKYYLADHGIREAVFGGNTRDIQQILENMVFLELMRRGYAVTVGKEGDREVDFVAEKQDRRLYVQVCYLLASPETIQREFGVYERIRDNFPKYVVSMDEIPMGRDGIHHCHIRDFLLDPSWSGKTTRQ